MLAALSALLPSCFMFGDISSERAHLLVEKGGRLIDVRSPKEFAEGHIQGAVNIPIGELPKKIATLGDRKQPTVLYCKSGLRSAKGAKLLRKAGFAHVYNLGPKSRW